MEGYGTEGIEFCAAGLEYGKCVDDGSSPDGASRPDYDLGVAGGKILDDATVAAGGELVDYAAAEG